LECDFISTPICAHNKVERADSAVVVGVRGAVRDRETTKTERYPPLPKYKPAGEEEKVGTVSLMRDAIAQNQNGSGFSPHRIGGAHKAVASLRSRITLRRVEITSKVGKATRQNRFVVFAREQPHGEVFIAIGRERGDLRSANEDALNLEIRTTPIFCWVKERWQQVHHHGSINDPVMLASYQDKVLKGTK